MTNLEVCKFDREGGTWIHSRHNKLDFLRIRLKSKENTDMKFTYCLIQKYFLCPPVSNFNPNPLHNSTRSFSRLILELKFNLLSMMSTFG